MSFTSRNLEKLENRVNVPIQPDEDGYVGRECPVEIQRTPLRLARRSAAQ
jgi:hypothetical protein